MRSLTARLTLAFLFVSLTAVALVAFLARQVTVREFDRLVLERARVNFTGDALDYYRDNGSWTGVAEYFRRLSLPPPPDAGGNGAPPRRPAAAPLEPRPLPVFPLVDGDGVVVLPAARYRRGDRVSEADLAQGIPLELDGSVVGTVLTNGERPALDPQEERYLDRTNRASIIAALGASLLAIALGVLLARTLTRPVRELTVATRAVAGGDLHQRVPVRSADELGQLAASFNQMSDDLSRAIEQRRRMTADIAHDLRTPLTVIAGYAESLRDGVLEATPDRLGVLHDEAQLLLRLVEDLRTLTLADAGELRLQRRPVPPAVLLKRVADAHALSAAQAGVALAFQSEAGIADIDGDEEWLVRLLGNLVHNALGHTPESGHVDLEAAGHADKVRITVRDDGTGVAPEALPHVFDRFYRADSSRNDAHGESGLGLAIAKTIAEAHGGAISVASALDQGSAFTVTLPAVGRV